MDGGHEKRATMSRRFRLLLEQVCDEHGGKKKHGVRTFVGKLFGLSQPHVHQLLHDKNPKWADHTTIEKARREFAPPLISWRFFTDEIPGDPHYRDFVIDEDGKDDAPGASSAPTAARRRVPYRDVLKALERVEPAPTIMELSQFLEVLNDHPADLQPREIRMLFAEGVRRVNERLKQQQAEELNAEKMLDLEELGGNVVPIKHGKPSSDGQNGDKR